MQHLKSMGEPLRRGDPDYPGSPGVRQPGPDGEQITAALRQSGDPDRDFLNQPYKETASKTPQNNCFFRKSKDWKSMVSSKGRF